MKPVSLRIARTLLYLAAGFSFAPPFMILALSREPAAAAPYAVLFFATGVAFIVAARDLAERRRRARLLAVSGAFALAALGTITGFSLGLVTLPGAAVGVLAAWATFLAPPRRVTVAAFVAYIAMGIAVAAARGGIGYIWAIPTVLIWPIWLMLAPTFSVLPIYAAVAVAVILALRALTPLRPFDATRGTVRVPLASAAALFLGVVAVVAFIGWAYARPDTSARFELTPLMVAVVFAAGALAGAGLVLVRSSALGAISLGIGATALFLAFTYGPAVACRPQGQSQRTPLEWVLTSSGGGSQGGSGTSGSIGAAGDRTVTSGEFTSGDRRAVYRCDGATVVEYREVR